MAQKAANQIHVVPSLRGFGLGFGAHHQVSLYRSGGPVTGELLAETDRMAVADWSARADRRSLTEILPPERLLPALQNRLLHGDTIELVRLMPGLLEAMPEAARAALFGAPMGRIAPEVWAELGQSRKRLTEDGFDPANPRPYFERLTKGGGAAQVGRNGEDLTFHGVSMEACAMILPMLLEAMEGKAKPEAVRILAEALHAAGEDHAFFAPLADPDLNRLVIAEIAPGDCQDIINNGRTLMIRSPNGPELRFQGETYVSSNLHFHPLKNPDGQPVMNLSGERDDKAEFAVYENAAQEARCKRQPQLDPSRRIVGQMHTIYTAKGRAPDKARALLLGADVVLGEANPQIGAYLDFLAAKHGPGPLTIIDDATDKAEVAEKGVPATEIAFDPLACYGRSFAEDGLPLAPFNSLHLGGLAATSPEEVGLGEGKSSVFYRGVRVIYLPEPITVSPEQFAALRAFQPELKAVDEATCVHPRQRFQPPKSRWLEVAPKDAFPSVQCWAR